MDRITGHLLGGGIYVKSETGKEGTGAATTQRRLPEIITRLAEYEDTGYTPEEFDKLCREMSDLRMTLCLSTYDELRKKLSTCTVLLVPRPGAVLYETDPEHGVVKHTVTDVHWVADTSAVDDKGKAWADYYTEEDIETAHQTREAAEAVLAAGSIMEGWQ